MTTSELLTQLSPRQVATFTLNRPEVGNACDPKTLTQLAAAIENAAGDSSVRVVVLRGAGRHFCSGADVRGPRPSTGERDVSFFQVCQLLDALPKPTVAVVQGGCVGGGLALAACCDVVLAAESDAFFAVPEVRLGLAPGPLALYFARAIGLRALRCYLLTGERFSAQTAQQLGLVHTVHPSGEVDSALEKVVDALLLGGPGAIGRAKTLLAAHGTASISSEVVEAIERGFYEQAATDEAHEGRASFREKRKPSWYLPADLSGKA